MTIDPLDIPCAYCSGKGEKHESIEYGVEISCYSCEVKVFVDDWITGGINALFGRIARMLDAEEDLDRPFPTFEEAVMYGWKKMQEEKS